ncbi:MAG: hypothetical protein JWL85_465 [Candidatus Saccharibacteria bacterium]|nr:hypothetical protein [Candidatus Saccharibacteria bacterium]
MLVHVFKTKVLPGADEGALKSAIRKLTAASEAYEGLLKAEVLLDKSGENLVSLLHWESEEAALKNTPKLNDNPGLTELIQLTDPSKLEATMYEVVDTWEK